MDPKLSDFHCNLINPVRRRNIKVPTMINSPSGATLSGYDKQSHLMLTTNNSVMTMRKNLQLDSSQNLFQKMSQNMRGVLNNSMDSRSPIRVQKNQDQNEYDDIKFMSQKIGGLQKLSIHPRIANPFLDKFSANYP
jgi:hypothetical protein